MWVHRLSASTPRAVRAGDWPEVRRIADILRKETVGGRCCWSARPCSRWSGRTRRGPTPTARCASLQVGPAALHLDLTLAQWAADGLLAIFFFVAGLELKREFVAGDLRDPRRAALPVAAAVGGMVVPAAALRARSTPEPATGAGRVGDPDRHRHRVRPGRAGGDRHPPARGAAHVPAHPGRGRRPARDHHHRGLLHQLTCSCCRCCWRWSRWPCSRLLVQRRVRSWWLLLPLAVATWALVHASGVHATVAGVLLGFAVPVRPPQRRGPGPGLAEHFEHRFRPLSAGVAVPVFAFFAAGVTIAGAGGLGASADRPDRPRHHRRPGRRQDRRRHRRDLAGRSASPAPELDEGLAWWDVLGLALLAGIGFTVSLLIGELAFGAGTERDDHVKVGVLLGSLLAALLATVVLRIRNRHYRRICAAGGPRHRRRRRPRRLPDRPNPTSDRLLRTTAPRLTALSARSARRCSWPRRPVSRP